MIPNLAEVVNLLSTDTYRVKRYAPATYLAGRVVSPPTTTILMATGSLQPMPGRTLERQPEGLEASDMRMLWTSASLRLLDEVEAEGSTWVAQAVEWNGPGGYWNVTLHRKEQTP